MIAYAWATGRIDFGRRMPVGALIIAKAPAKPLRKAVTGYARLAYDGKTWLVPGVPEADTQNDGIDALLAFCRGVEKRLVENGVRVVKAAGSI